MPIKVFFPRKGDPYAVAETAQEAAELLKFNSNGTAASADELIPAGIEWGVDARVAQFFLGINENARKLMLALLKHEKGVRGELFSEETGVSSEKFGGIFGGASKIAKKHGLRIQQFVHSQFVVKGSERYRFFKPGKLLLDYAEKLKQAAKEGAVRIG